MLGACEEFDAEQELAEKRESQFQTDDPNRGSRDPGSMNDYDSFDYDVYESKQWLDYSVEQTSTREFKIDVLRWVVLGAIGFVTGSTAFAIDAGVKYLMLLKFWLIQKALKTSDSDNGRSNFWDAFGMWILISLGLCSIAGVLVCFVESCAAGSGIPEIKCRLNGIRMKRVLRFKTFFTKVMGVLFSVAGGLPVGKEGPMIHSGAIVGSGLNQLKSKFFGCDMISGRDNSKLRFFRNDVEKRDMIAAGASAGVAAAFGAPIGGVLFALEEGCSFWNVKITWGNLFCAMVSSTTINLFATAINTSVRFGLLAVPGMITFGNFAVSKATAFNIWEIPYFIVIGCGGGLIGAAFNHLNKLLTQWRLKSVNRNSKLRFAEVLLVALVVAVFSIMFPYIADDCRRIANPLNSPTDISVANPPSDLANRGACFQKDCECSFELRGGIIRLSEEKWEYDCFHDDTIKESLVQFACPNDHYSPAASLSFAKGDDVIKGLLHNPEHLDMTTLFIFFCIYFALACWTYGIGVPSGLFVPSLIIGAAYGRFVGQALDAANMLGSDASSDRLGVYALVGASAMLAGMARITISLTVILIECTNDVQYAPAIMTAVLCAKWVADLFNHGLYDIHIHLKHIPLLEPFSETHMFSIAAEDVMSERVEVIPQVCSLQTLIESFTATHHSTYPVVTDHDGSGQHDNSFVGILRRDFICAILNKHGMHLLQKTVEIDDSMPVQAWDIVQDQFPDWPTIKDATAWATPEQKKMFINLLPYVNTNAYCVRNNTCMRRVYTLFRGMGLRGLPVLQLGSNKVVGMITRENLSEQSIEEYLAKQKDKLTRHTVPQMQVEDNTVISVDGSKGRPSAKMMVNASSKDDSQDEVLQVI